MSRESELIMIVDEILKYDGPFTYVDGLIFSITSHITQIDVEHHPRLAGQSNYNLIRSIKVWLKLATGFSVIPLRVATFTADHPRIAPRSG